MDSPPPRHGLLAASEAAAATRTARVGCPARLGSGSNSGCLSTFNLLYLFFIFRLLPPLSLPLLTIASYPQSLCTLMNLLRSIFILLLLLLSLFLPPLLFLIFAALLCLFTVKGHTHTQAQGWPTGSPGRRPILHSCSWDKPRQIARVVEPTETEHK